MASYVDQLGLEVKGSEAERLGLLVTLVMLLFALVSTVIIGLSALNIAHTFLMLIAERQREIGVLRAMGATQRDVRRLILGEAGIIGTVGGILGVLGAIVAGTLCDWISATYVPNFPYKPDSYFVFSVALMVGAIAFAMLCCIVGAIIPAQRAARLNPAQALTSP